MNRKVKKKVKYYYKNILINFFSKVFNKPKILKKNQYDKSVIENHINIDNNKYTIFQLTNGRVYTDSNDTTAYISANNYLSEASLQYSKFDTISSKNNKISKNITLQTGTPKFQKRIKGKILSLLSGGASRDNFTHWFTDVIPRIEIFCKKFKLHSIDKFYVPSLKHQFQKDSLRILGIKENQIISTDTHKHIVADKIFATSHPCYHLPMSVKKWSLNYLNKIYLTRPYKDKFKKIFIDRDQHKLIKSKDLNNYRNLRILLNEKEIKDYLLSKGFTILKPEKCTFSEQVKIFSSAKQVVGLYGAAMMMLSFCKRNTKVLEIKPIHGGNEFLNISKIRKLKHKQINLKPKIKSSIKQNGLLYCPIKVLQKYID